MSETTDGVNEPSMEKIMDSIREMISEDVEKKVNEKLDTDDNATSEDETEVLDLTEMVSDEGEIVSLAQDAYEVSDDQEPESTEAEADADALTEASSEEIEKAEGETTETPASAENAPEASEERHDNDQANQNDTSMEDLVSEEAVEQTVDALSGLDAIKEHLVDSVSTSEATNKTVEGLVRELVKPMLREWLDTHLPSLVKWIVTEQVERVMKQKFGVEPNDQAVTQSEPVAEADNPASETEQGAA